jgi:hypothetical protein
MSVTLDALGYSACARRKTCPAAPARRDHTRMSPRYASVFTLGVAPGAEVAAVGEQSAWDTHRSGILSPTRQQFTSQTSR